jgi:hypothetical protein
MLGLSILKAESCGVEGSFTWVKVTVGVLRRWFFSSFWDRVWAE